MSSPRAQGRESCPLGPVIFWVWPFTSKLARWPLGGPVPAGWESSEGAWALDSEQTGGQAEHGGRWCRWAALETVLAGLWVPGARSHLTLASSLYRTAPSSQGDCSPTSTPTGHPMAHPCPSRALDLFFALSCLFLALPPAFPGPCPASGRHGPLLLFPSVSPEIQKALVERQSPSKTQVSPAPLSWAGPQAANCVGGGWGRCLWQRAGWCQQASRQLCLRTVEDSHRTRRSWLQELPHKPTPLFIEHLLRTGPHRVAV